MAHLVLSGVSQAAALAQLIEDRKKTEKITLDAIVGIGSLNLEHPNLVERFSDEVPFAKHIISRVPPLEQLVEAMTTKTDQKKIRKDFNDIKASMIFAFLMINAYQSRLNELEKKIEILERKLDNPKDIITIYDEENLKLSIALKSLVRLLEVLKEVEIKLHSKL